MGALINIQDLVVYVAEPSKMQSHVVCLALNQLGVTKLQTFVDGNSLLQQMASVPPAVVISAMHLPDMTGSELVVAMRNADWGSRIAFILISSESNPRYLEPVRQSGSSAILRKPFTEAQLKHAMRTALDYLNPDPLEFEFSEDIDFERFKVLLVDDSKMARKFMRQVLENIGMENFVEAENGRLAAEEIQKQAFDLVVTDYNMPEMDGKELTEFIRTRSMQVDVPVLMVSSESNQRRLAAVEQAGVSGVCDKPFEPTVVKMMLEQLLFGED